MLDYDDDKGLNDGFDYDEKQKNNCSFDVDERLYVSRKDRMMQNNEKSFWEKEKEEENKKEAARNYKYFSKELEDTIEKPDGNYINKSNHLGDISQYNKNDDFQNNSNNNSQTDKKYETMAKAAYIIAIVSLIAVFVPMLTNLSLAGAILVLVFTGIVSGKCNYPHITKAKTIAIIAIVAKILTYAFFNTFNLGWFFNYFF